MFLVHDKLTIRNAEKQDAPILASWWNDGAVMAHAGFPRGLGTTPGKIAEEIAADCDGSRRRLILEIGEKPVGEMSFTILRPLPAAEGENSEDPWKDWPLYRGIRGATAEIGIKICDAAYQEKGFGRIFLSMLIRELLRRGAVKIVLDTNLKNTRAQHVYEKLGFVKQGVRMNSWRDQEGVLQSAVDYALTENEFVDYSGESEKCPVWSYRACTGEDLKRLWDMNVADHPGKPIWERFRSQAFRHDALQMAKTYAAVRNGRPVGEGTLLFSPECEAVGELKHIVIPGEVCNVNGLRIRKEYEGQGHISRMMKLMEQDAAVLGFHTVTIGVEPRESRNLAIYLHWGYTDYLEYEFDHGALVIYYGKELCGGDGLL